MAGDSSMDTRGPGAAAPSDSTTAPLSAGDQAALDRGRGTRLPLVFVLLSLTFAVLLPQLSQRRTTRLRNEVNLYADPARQRLTAIQLYLTRGVTFRRGYLLTHNPRLIKFSDDSRLLRQDAERNLVRFGHMLDGARAGKLTRLAIRLEEADRDLDSAAASTERPVKPGAGFATFRKPLERVQVIADSLALAIDSATSARHRDVAEIEMISTVLTVILVLFGLGAAFLVAQLGTKYRTLAIKLDEQQARFRQIAENLGDVVWLAEPGFQKHLYVNRAYERIWGRTRASLADNPESLIEGVHPEDRARVREAFSKIAEETTNVEFRVVRPDGEVCWVHSRGFPVRRPDGKVFRITGIIEDITGQRRYAAERERLLEGERAAREEAEHRQKDLERVTESRVRLLRGFTHDVKNPLGAADGYLALMIEGALGGLPKKQHETLVTVRRSISHALELIRKLLDVARAEAGQLDVHQESTDLVEIVREVTESYRPQARAKELTLEVQMPDRCPALCTDPARVRQVVGNLVSNAVKYTPNVGRVCVEVRVDQRQGSNIAGDNAYVIVADNGPGIEPDKLPLLFIEFTRFDTGAADGAGIGLAISQKIAQALGGEISVENLPNRGCSFTLRLPVAMRPKNATKSAA